MTSHRDRVGSQMRRALRELYIAAVDPFEDDDEEVRFNKPEPAYQRGAKAGADNVMSWLSRRVQSVEYSPDGQISTVTFDFAPPNTVEVKEADKPKYFKMQEVKPEDFT